MHKTPSLWLRLEQEIRLHRRSGRRHPLDRGTFETRRACGRKPQTARAAAEPPHWSRYTVPILLPARLKTIRFHENHHSNLVGGFTGGKLPISEFLGIDPELENVIELLNRKRIE